MKISEMIGWLESIKQHHGDLPIVGGCLSDDIPPSRIAIIDDGSRDAEMYGTKPTGVFIE